MNEFDPDIDLIDRYLRGELKDAEHAAFMTKLQADATFKKEVQNRERLAAAVYAYGHAEMKKYLRHKTRHRGIFSLSKKTWYFAAASVLLIAFSSVIIIWKMNQGENRPPIITKTNQDPEVREKPAVSSDSRVKTPNDSNKSNEEIVAGNTETSAPPLESGDESDDADVAESEPIIIASNVPAVAIDLNNSAEDAQKSLKTEATEMRQSRTVEASDQPVAASGQVAKTKPASPVENSASDFKQPAKIRNKKAAVRFSFTFCETPRNKPMVEVEKNNDIYIVRCFDIVYGNPLVYEWQNRFFLNSGFKTYELKNLPAQNGQKIPATDASEVTDPTILKLIGQ